MAGHEPGGGELRDGEKHDGVYSCLFTVGKGRILYFSSSQDLNFVLTLPSAFNFTLWTASVVYGSGKGGAGEVTLIQPIE